MKIFGRLARAGKVKGQTPKVKQCQLRPKRKQGYIGIVNVGLSYIEAVQEKDKSLTSKYNDVTKTISEFQY